MLPGLSVACCFRGYLPDEQSLFFKTAATNRGVRAEFFARARTAEGEREWRESPWFRLVESGEGQMRRRLARGGRL